ncbi:unnamed protein product [Clavelina lepadiformis]|uniref:EF-hand domain-containing protein n=1 Tax=Clavelina lepadiformis TaxID=159417 RepID=A0ABP0F8Q6_CLALP
MRCFVCILAITLVCLCRGIPLKTADENEAILPAGIVRLHHHRHHHYRHRGSLENPPSNSDRLRRLDALITRLQMAKTQRLSSATDEEDLSDSDVIRNNTEEVSDVDQPDDIPVEEASDFSMVELPYNYQRYDLNKDGFVTVLELADATGTLLEDAVQPFTKADANADGLLTENELYAAPWVFDMHRKAFGTH